MNNTILSELEHNQIFSVEVVGDKAIFTEECDQFFTKALNKAELAKLIKELTVIMVGIK